MFSVLLALALTTGPLLGVAPGAPDDPHAAAQLEKLSDLNCRLVRLEFDLKRWPQNGVYPFVKEDAMAQKCSSRGMSVVGLIDYCPVWANRQTWAKYHYQAKHPWENAFCPHDDIAVWKQQVKTIMQRNKGRVFLYEIWNEPDSGYFLPPKATPEITKELIRTKYVPMCQAAQEASREVDPTGVIKVLTICSSQTAFYTENWVKWCFDEGIQKYTDGVVVHNYPWGYQGTGAWDTQWSNLWMNLTKCFDEHHCQFPVYVTEFGYQKTTADGRYPADAEQEPAAVFAQCMAMLGSTYRGQALVQGLSKHRLPFEPVGDRKADAAWGVYDFAKDRPLPAYALLKRLGQVFSDVKSYEVLTMAMAEPNSEPWAGMSGPEAPLVKLRDNKVVALSLTRNDGGRRVLLAAWRSRFWQWAKLPPGPVQIGDQTVVLTIPGDYRGWSVQRINLKDGSLAEFGDVTRNTSQLTLTNVLLRCAKDRQDVGDMVAFVLERELSR